MLTDFFSSVKVNVCLLQSIPPLAASLLKMSSNESALASVAPLHTSYSSHSTFSCSGDPQPWARYIAVAMTSTTALVGTILNLLALLVFVQQARTKPFYRLIKFSSDRILVVNLVLVDLSYCIVVLPFTGFFYIWPHEDSSACIFSGISKYTVSVAEILTISLIALERYCIVALWNSLFLMKIVSTVWTTIFFQMLQ